MNSAGISLAELALDRSPDQIFWANHSGRLIYVNQVACTALGYSRDELLAMCVSDICPNLPLDAWEKHWRELRQQGQMRFEAMQTRHDGSPLQIEVIVHHVVFAEEELACCYVRDISISMEEQLRLARNAAETASRSKSEFLAQLSHEIRTSMNGVIGMTELLRTTTVNKQQQEFLDMLQASADGLLFLINDTLDLARIEAGKISLCMTEMSLENIIHEVTESQRYMLGLKNLRIQLDLDDLPNPIIGDAQHLKQILLNLLVNAIKFTECGQITIRTRLLEQNSQKILVRMSVADTGIGMHEDALQRIFAPFEQADAETAGHFGGSGLGLTICKQLTKMLGGEIEVESKVGKGSVFHVTLPFNMPCTAAEPSASGLNDCQPADAVAPRRILIVEDNEMIQTLLCTLLQHMGHEGVCCNDGQNALELVQKEKFDLIFMDIRMPVMDGLQALHHIRALEKRAGQHQRIIALTAHAMAGDREKYLRAGFDGYLSKPLKMQELNEVLSEIPAAETSRSRPAEEENKSSPSKVNIA